MNKTMEVHKAEESCNCGTCVDCKDCTEHVRLMDEARAHAKATGDLCNICGSIGVLTQGACYDCCRLCTTGGCDEPRSLTSLVCDKCLAKTIKPMSNIPVKQGPTLHGYGAYANVNGNQEIHLMSSRQSKFLHLRRACHYDCGYCYQEACDWLEHNNKENNDGA